MSFCYVTRLDKSTSGKKKLILDKQPLTFLLPSNQKVPYNKLFMLKMPFYEASLSIWNLPSSKNHHTDRTTYSPKLPQDKKQGAQFGNKEDNQLPAQSPEMLYQIMNI